MRGFVPMGWAEDDWPTWCSRAEQHELTLTQAYRQGSAWCLPRHLRSQGRRRKRSRRQAPWTTLDLGPHKDRRSLGVWGDAELSNMRIRPDSV